ncbi:hypothetical protein P3S67_005005 [Capsicum chacoense]
MYAPAPPDVPSVAYHQYHSGPSFGFVRRYFSNLCLALSSCFYILCCCWVLEDGVGRPRWEVGSAPGPLGPNPPDIPITLPGPPGPPQGTLMG